MPSAFPASVDTFSAKADHVTTIAAADVNNLQNAVVAIESTLHSAPSPNPLDYPSKAEAADYVSKTKAETISGLKSFSASPIVLGAGWTVDANGNLGVRSVTASAGNGPNTNTAVVAGGDYSGALRIAGGKPWYDPTHPSYAGGAKGDGVTDDTAAIQAALAAAAVVGGLVLLIVGVYLISALLTIASGVWLQGSGIGGDTFSQTDAGFTSKGTRIVMAANANVDIIQSANFGTLTGVGNPDVHTIPERFKISDLVLDGNNFVQSGGASNGNTASRALVVYGRDYRTDNVVMQNCGGDGWYSESRTVAGYAEESLHSNIRVQFCGGNGLTHKGPHDSQLVNAFFSKCGGSGVQVLSTSGSFRCTNVHNWGCAQYQWDIQNSDTSCANCTSDGVGTATKVGVRVTASRVQWRGGSIYGSNGQGEALVQLGMGDGGAYTVEGCVFDTLWYNIALGSACLRYMSGVDTLTAIHNWFGRFTFNTTNSRAVVGAGKTTVNGAQAGNSATLTVTDTTSFPAAGSLFVGAQGSGGDGQSSITYSGKTPTTFTGCTGGNAAQTIPDQAVIFEQQARIVTPNRETWWFESGDEGSSASLQQGFQGTAQKVFDGQSKQWSGTQQFNGNVGFYGTSPVAQPANTVDLRTALATLGLLPASSGWAPVGVDPLAAALGYLNWNYNPAASGGGTALTSGRIDVCAVWLPPGVTVANVVLDVTTAGSGAQPTTFQVGIMTATKMLQQSGDLHASALLTSAGTKAFALTSTYLTSVADSPTGLYYFVVLQVGAFGGTNVVFARGNAGIPGYSLNNSVFGNIGTGATALPANASVVAITPTAGQGWHGGFS